MFEEITHRNEKYQQLFLLLIIFTAFVFVILEILLISNEDDSTEIQNINIWQEQFLKILSLKRKLIKGSQHVLESFSYEHDDNITFDSPAKILEMTPKNARKYLTAEHKYLKNYNIKDLKFRINDYNHRQKVHNADLYEPMLNDTVVIVVQVHDRVLYLRHLIISLSQATNISDTLLIFSHDYFDAEINDLIRSIDFCKVMQIFYPYSLQLFPNQFPGDNPNDCSNKRPKLGKSANCTNAGDKDMYGNYREGKYSQIKHHWWWKVNFIFNKLTILKNHNGLVVFLEEDQFVLKDFVYILKLMEGKMVDLNADCLSFGDLGHLKSIYKYFEFREVNSFRNNVIDLVYWTVKGNTGLAFNKKTWTKIANCSIEFCTYDDYNWDWSLNHISDNCIRMHLTTISLRAPRIFHTGICGVHHTQKVNCEWLILPIMHLKEFVDKFLYPTNFTISLKGNGVQHVTKFNGGWGDRRDHELCINNSETR